MQGAAAFGTALAALPAERDTAPRKGMQMQVQVNTNNHVEGSEKLIEHVEGVIRTIAALPPELMAKAAQMTRK